MSSAAKIIRNERKWTIMIQAIALETLYISQAFEVVVATVIILVTGFVAFLLFLSVRRDFKTEIENRKMMKQSGETEDDKEKIVVERKSISKKSKASSRSSIKRSTVPRKARSAFFSI